MLCRPKRSPSLSHLLWAPPAPDLVSPETSRLQASALAPTWPQPLCPEITPCCPWHLSVDLVLGNLGKVGRHRITRRAGRRK